MTLEEIRKDATTLIVSDLLQALKATKKAVRKDKLVGREIISTYYFKGEGDAMRVIGTDAYKLVSTTILQPLKKDFCLKYEDGDDLAGYIKGKNRVLIKVSDNKVRFYLEEDDFREYDALNVDGYPEIDKIIPDYMDEQAQPINAKELACKVRDIERMASPKTKGVLLHDNKITIEREGYQASIEIDYKLERVRVNASYLKEILANYKTMVTIKVLDINRPVMFSGDLEGVQIDNNKSYAMLMPIRD